MRRPWHLSSLQLPFAVLSWSPHLAPTFMSFFSPAFWLSAASVLPSAFSGFLFLAMSGGTLSSDFEMLKAHLLDILRAHEGMRVFSPREDGSTRRGPWIRELEKGMFLFFSRSGRMEVSTQLGTPSLGFNGKPPMWRNTHILLGR